MDQYIGKLLDNRYEILERVGSGGMAVVYKARCHRLNRLVAIKILKTDLAQDAEFRRRFHDESQAVAMLSHPNIMAVYDVSHSDDLDYIVMELIDGITLKQYMQKKGEPLNWREALHFITQIMKGLSHAHSRGIIHRDIKPHNIMILRDGSVKVADFGIARLTSAAQNTLTQEALGSVHYISPEQARGSRIDARSDIYSAGVVLYEMVTGRLPYEGDSPISVAIQHINSIPLSPREINPEIPEALEAITMKAMAANVEQRYASADAMLADLEEFRKNPSINFDYTDSDLQVGTDEPTQVMDTSGRHNFHAAAAAGAAGAGGRSGGGRGTPAGAEERPRRGKRYEEPDEEEYDDYEDDRRRSRRRGRDKGSPVPIVLAIGAILVFLVGIGYFLWVSIISGILNPDSPDYQVPDLQGKTMEQVALVPEVADGTFTIEIGKTVKNPSFGEGEIVTQDPVANSVVKEGNRVITVDINESSSTLTLENYANHYRIAEVKAKLESKGILVDVTEEPSDTVTAEYIISQDPAAGTEVKAGDRVSFVVSSGVEEKKVTVISFIGVPLETVKSQIQELGLIVGSVKEVFDEEQPAGNVVWQSTDPNTEVPEKTVINLQVSKGPDEGAVDPSPTPSPDQTPDESETPTPTPTTPTPTPSQPAIAVQKSIEVSLPDDRDVVHVSVMVGGVEKYSNDVDTHFRTIYPVVEGQGVQTVEVYIDVSLVDSQSIDFSKD